MSLYVSEKVGNEIVLKKYAPAVPVYRGFWAVTIGGFAGTLVECNGSMRYIGSNEKTIYQIVEPGTYTFTATRHGETKSKTIVLDDKDPNNSYTVNLGLYIGMQYLEYIEADADQFIDTGFLPNNNTRVVADFMVTSYVSVDPSYYSTLFCARTSTNVDSYGEFICSQNNPNQSRSDYNTEQLETTGSIDYLLKRVTVDKNKNVTTYSYNGSVVSTITATPQTFDTPYSLYIFKINSGGTTTGYPRTRLYSFKIYDNDVLVRDFVPIKDDTNHGALYDKVTQQIFYNSGEGEFICGPNKPYTRIQYIEGTTCEQYIDTGIIPTSDMTYYGKFGFVEFISSQNILQLFGSRNVSGTPNGVYASVRSTGTGLDFFDTNRYELSTSVTRDDVFDFTIENHVSTIKKNGTVVGTHTFSTTTDTTDYPLHLNALISGGVVDNIKGTSRIYSFKVLNHGTLVRDMIPILDNEDTPCMYDQVNDRLYYNSGTGEFIAGPEKILPDEYDELEYLQSTGTQYINTGIHNADCDIYKVKTKYNYTSISNNSLCGNYASSGYASFGQIFLDTSNNSSVYSGIGNAQRVTFGNMTTNTDYTDEFTIDCTLGTITRTLNGTTRSGNELNFSSRQDQPCFLYCCNRGAGVPEQFGSEKIYYFQIYKDDNLVCNFIPAKRISDNVLGMYDSVTDTFFTNAGTGQFIAGPVKQ